MAYDDYFQLAFSAFGNAAKPSVAHSLEEFRELTLPEQLQTFVPDSIVNKIPHEESHDALISLDTFLKQHQSNIALAPQTTEYGATNIDLQLRKTAAERLFIAEKELQKRLNNVTFRLTDAYRPLSLQRKHFNHIMEEVHNREGLSGKDLYDKAHMLVADPELFPPHTTGGAVDLTIIDLITGQELDMGTAIDALNDEKIFTFHCSLTDEQKQNRSVLYASMATAGFVGFPCEWWHFSYGEKEWAMRGGHPKATFAPL